MSALMIATAVIMAALTVDADLIDFSCLHYNNWRMNSNSHRNANFDYAKTDCTGGGPTSVNTKWTVTYSMVPNYDRYFTAADITTLNSRPLASTDFNNGKVNAIHSFIFIFKLLHIYVMYQTTASAGSYYAWGDDIGYSSDCDLGYWPHGDTNECF